MHAGTEQNEQPDDAAIVVVLAGAPDRGQFVIRQYPLACFAVLFGWIVPMIGLFSTMPICIAHTKNVDNAARARAATIEPCSRAIVTRRAARSRRVTVSR